MTVSSPPRAPGPAAPGPLRAADAGPLLVGLAAFAIVVLVIHLHLMVQRTGAAFMSFDSAEYALAGRALARTGRLTTSFAYPAQLPGIPGPPFPLVAGHPLVPVIDAILFAIGGARPMLTLVPPAFAYLASVLLTAVLALRLSGSRAVAACAGAAFALSPQALPYAIDGLSEMPFTALFIGVLVLLFDLPGRPRAVLLGALAGLAHLARPVMVPMLPAILAGAWFLAAPSARARTLGLVLAGFAPFAAALALYHLVALGHPFADSGGYLLLTHARPEFTVLTLNRMIPPPAPLPWIAAHPGDFARKIARIGPDLVLAGFNLGGVLAGVLVLLRLVTPHERRTRVFQLTVLGAAALLAGAALLTAPSPRILVPLLPALFALAIDEAYRLVTARGLSPRLALVACVAVVIQGAAFPTAWRWKKAWADPRSPLASTRLREVEWRALGRMLDERLPIQGVVASDAAPWIAWYTGRDATLIPAGTAMLDPLGKRLPLSAIVLTNEWVIFQQGEEPWRAWFDGHAEHPDWQEVARLGAGKLKAVILLPRPR